MNHSSTSKRFSYKDQPGIWRRRSTWKVFLTALAATVACILLSEAGTARTWHVPEEAATIQAGIDSAGVGDDVLVAPGHYQEHDIIMKAGIWVHSEGGAGVTTVDAGAAGVGFICTGLQEQVTIEGFMILDGLADGSGEEENSGGGLRCVDSNVVTRDCVITGCIAGYAGGGIYAWESEVHIVGCRVTDCAAYAGGAMYAWYQPTVRVTDCEMLRNEAVFVGGIGAVGAEVTIERCVVSGNHATWGYAGGILCESPVLTIRDCLITENIASVIGEGSGLLATNSSGVIDGCTVVKNSALPRHGAIYLNNSGIQISRTIVAFNEDKSLECPGSQVTFHCCDVYGNTEGDDLCGTDHGGNFSEDPLFCNPENGDYTLNNCSPCLPGNHPEGADCGLIGALGQGCGATPVEETSWGRIKSLYRR